MPLLANRVISIAATYPEKYTPRGLTTKYLLKRVLRKLLPAENLARRKMGFGVPITHWLRARLAPFLRETLLSERSLRRGLFKPEVVARLVAEPTAAQKDHAHQLWTLLMLELWFQRFID